MSSSFSIKLYSSPQVEEIPYEEPPDCPEPSVQRVRSAAMGIMQFLYAYGFVATPYMDSKHTTFPHNLDSAYLGDLIQQVSTNITGSFDPRLRQKINLEMTVYDMAYQMAKYGAWNRE